MTGSCLCFAGLIAIVRHVSTDMNVFVISFWRALLSVPFFLPWLISAGMGGMKTTRGPRLVLRALCMTISFTCMFFAAALMPMADATAISFTTPMFTGLFAVLLLREHITRWQWLGLVFGAIGVVLILKPGAGVFDPAAILPIGSAAAFGAVIVLGRSLVATDTSEAMAFNLTLWSVPMTLVPALFFWQWPRDFDQWMWLLALGGLAGMNQYCVARAVRSGPAALSMPFDFVRLPFVTLAGFIFFNELPAWTTWAGAAIIVAGAIFVTYRESLRRVTRTPPA